LRRARFAPIETRNGTTASGPNQTQTPEGVPAAKEICFACTAPRDTQRKDEEANRGSVIISRKRGKVASRPLVMSERARYLIVDGHSIIFAWPELRKLHNRSTALARETLIKRLRHYQDWTHVRVIVVFDGRGTKLQITAEPHDIQIFYSRTGQTADAIIERLAGRYAKRFELVVATSDFLEQQTAAACGAECISPEALLALLKETENRVAKRR
jgi:predicted RNA-binding protein with PIN domain